MSPHVDDVDSLKQRQPTTATVANLARQYKQVRQFSEVISSPLTAEDCAMQTMPDVSPTRWHLAHTTWFFETFLLKSLPHYKVFDESFEFLFNSYYNAVGEQFARHRRGQLSRPGLLEVLSYREHVDAQLDEFLQLGELGVDQMQVLLTGLHHEQQHQELMLTDIKHVLATNPLKPVYREGQDAVQNKLMPLTWNSVSEQVIEVGHAGDGFAFDNESPRHRALILNHQLANRCVSNQEYSQFIQDGGYERPELWLSLGWAKVQEENWGAPLYWTRDPAGSWAEYTLSGVRPVEPSQPVCHVSYFEADAFARWAGARLPTEFEWEHAAGTDVKDGWFADLLIDADAPIHPRGDEHAAAGVPGNLYGNVWEWTSSSYCPYPGFSAAAGALGEYNGKFMCNQYVLRGGSVATSSSHIRPTYRNFFPPDARWQFSGIRLAK